MQNDKMMKILTFVAALVVFACSSEAICTDTRCGGSARLCCEDSTALQKKSMCIGTATCDACCGWIADNETIPAAAAAWVEALELVRQPFGNFFAATFTSSLTVNDLPSNFEGGTRALSGDIYNLYALNRSDTSLAQGGFPLHRLEGDELYHYYAGDGPILIHEFDFATGKVNTISVGVTSPRRDRPQHTIVSGTWSGALLADGVSWALTGAETTPAFDPRDSKMAASNASLMSQFYRRFPDHEEIIMRLTSFGNK